MVFQWFFFSRGHGKSSHHASIGFKIMRKILLMASFTTYDVGMSLIPRKISFIIHRYSSDKPIYCFIPWKKKNQSGFSIQQICVVCWRQNEVTYIIQIHIPNNLSRLTYVVDIRVQGRIQVGRRSKRVNASTKKIFAS